MSVISAALIGAALAADAFAVSVVCGSSDGANRKGAAVMTAAAFGIFQTFMPVLGWSIGKVGSTAVTGFENIIAFGVLVFLGTKMIIDSRNGAVKDFPSGMSRVRSLLAMAVATSIDALTVGIVLPTAAGAGNVSELLCVVLIIGGITFFLSFCGYHIGRKIRTLDPTKAQIIGGIVLILIGIKELF